MSAIALMGSVTLLLEASTFDRRIEPLVAFAAGNFIYIGPSDPMPEVDRPPDIAANVTHFLAFVTGVGLLWAIRMGLHA